MQVHYILHLYIYKRRILLLFFLNALSDIRCSYVNIILIQGKGSDILNKKKMKYIDYVISHGFVLANGTIRGYVSHINRNGTKRRTA